MKHLIFSETGLNLTLSSTLDYIQLNSIIIYNSSNMFKSYFYLVLSFIAIDVWELHSVNVLYKHKYTKKLAFI